MPDLSEVDLSEGSRCVADGFNSTELRITLSDGSHAELEGSASDLIIDASEGSHAKLSELHVKNADVTLSEGSDATINIDGNLDADLSEGSHLFYTGTPTMGKIQTSDGSDIRKQ